ncbi:MAG: NAD-dependent DNA ligase LigA, partial [bacterium]
MSRKDIQHELARLKESLRQHEYNYYVRNNPTIADKEYDELISKLVSLEEKYPELKTSDSPSQRVGGEPFKEFKNAAHKIPMLSLDNTYSVDDIKEWEKRIKKLTSNTLSFIVDPKIDGVSLSLIYKDGILTQALTRGNGTVGEDITSNARTIKNIPLKLTQTQTLIPAYIEIRGEAFMEIKSFNEFNAGRLNAGDEPFANPRNATAGSLKLLDPKITSKRNILFIAHSKGFITDDVEFKTHGEFLDFCTKAGIRVSNAKKKCSTIDEAVSYCNTLEETRDSFLYEIDGAVIKVNSTEEQQKLGQTLKSPRWAIAFKFAARQVTTIVTAIVHQVGRTGVITPVAELKPVVCGGVVISRATLHNYDEVQRLSITPGDRVLVERAGDVIPKIVKVIEKAQTGKHHVIRPPVHCPQCKTTVVKENEDLVAYRCPNTSCPAVIAGNLLHFVSRSALDIEGMGDALVEQLISKKHLKDASDIYALSKEDLLTLDLVAEKKAENLINSIMASKNRPLHNLLFGLGIRNVGEKAARILAERYKTLPALMKAPYDELVEIPEIGPIMAGSITAYFKLAKTKKIIENLSNAGVNFNAEERKIKSHALEGLRIAVTGEAGPLSRNEIENLIREHGGKPTSSVSSKTDMVVVGAQPGKKKEKAEKLKIKMLSFNEFIKMVQIHPHTK